MDVDVVIVGAGAAGCVLANRLSADPRISVLLLEQGGPDRHPWLVVPRAFARAIDDPRFVSAHATRPVVPGGPPETWVRGRVLGGSTAVNGAMWARGRPVDHDRLADGDTRWDGAAMREAYRALEDHEFGASPTRGAGGPLAITVPPVAGVVDAALVAAAERLGVPHVVDVNAVDGPCIGPVPATIRAGRRASAATAFLHPVRHRRNLVVRTGQQVVAPVVEDGRATGVRVRTTDGSTRVHRAHLEVVLCAGTIGSPVLLERAGIGDPARLAAVGIEPRVTAPRVGEGVREQRGVVVQARLGAGLGRNHLLATPVARAREVLRWATTRRGVLARPAHDLAARVRTGAIADPRPDAQVLLADVSADATGLAVERVPGLLAVGYPLRPTTTSSVHATGPDPHAPPDIRARHLETAADRATTVGTLAWIRRLLATAPVADLVVRETIPGPAVDDAVAHALATGTGIFHAVGSCAAGHDAGSVVDADLRVRGVAGLRVVDASVFPALPAAGTAAPTMALAWRAADLLAASW